MSAKTLDATKLAFSFGVFWGLGMLLAGWGDWLFGYAKQFVSVFGSIYIGFKPTFIGAIIGGAWGFVDFFVFIWLVIWLYDRQCSSKA
ncbi:MAG: bacteriophage holin [Gammaproteobacteria bacterium]|nr:bacteriophage holin [Gammaproteobacteria bacterium]MCH9743999.1 bacteriophage holin [Gammaproteobacteria bacterium]